jgi:hypothetical protein
MPASATADGTVQLSMPGGGGGGSDSKLLMPDALLSHKQRDQSSADIEAVPAGGGLMKGAHVHAEPDSPMGLALSDDGHHLADHDDDASR